MHKTILIFVFAVALTAGQFGVVSPATAGPGACPVAGPCGGTVAISSSIVSHMNPTVCSGGMFTNSYQCGDAISGAFAGGWAACGWTDVTTRTMDVAGGCIFECNGGATKCKVGNDGLPVELIGFSAE